MITGDHPRTAAVIARELGLDSSARTTVLRVYARVDRHVRNCAGTGFVLDASLPGGYFGGTGDLRYAQTMAFTTLVLFQMFNVLNARSHERSASFICSRTAG
jgi:magnesium-transporting ATPase (P-type)